LYLNISGYKVKTLPTDKIQNLPETTGKRHYVVNFAYYYNLSKNVKMLLIYFI
jgi:hypothetical protein